MKSPEENDIREETYSCELSPFKPATALKKIRAFNQHKLEEFERYIQEKKEFVHQTTEEKVMAMKKGAPGIKLFKPGEEDLPYL